jgi:hypothetical protein
MQVKQVVRVAAAASALLMVVSAQAALVKFRMTGVVTQSGVFDDGTMVAEGTPVTVNFSYETKAISSAMDRHEDGSGFASYDFAAPYRLKLRAGDHRVHVERFGIALNNDLNQPFGDTFDVLSQGGASIDGVTQAGASLGISLLSQGGNLDALRSLRLPKHLNEWAFDAFRAGKLSAAGDRTLLMFRIDSIKSTACAQAVPGTDACAE